MIVSNKLESNSLLGPKGLFFADCLIALFFTSKLSIAFMRFIPYNIPPFIYQGGMHPYLNILGNIIFGIGLLLCLKPRPLTRSDRYYLVYITIFLATLVIQTFLQMAFVHPDKSIFFQMSGAFMAIMTVVFFGVVIPLYYPAERFIKLLLIIGLVIVVISVTLLPLFGPNMFRGGRFVGITKHIPHMVTISSLVSIFLIARWPSLFKLSYPAFIVSLLLVLISFFAVALTATKAALGSVVLACLIALFFFGAKNKLEQWGRLFVLASMTICLVFLSPVVGDTLYEVASGERALLGRPAQNGFETRWEEVVRGGDLFAKSPHLGLGILYKFMTGAGDGDVDTYNSFKDPHNIFLSAGVIAGWPFMIIVAVGYMALLFGCLNILRPQNKEKYDLSYRTIALFLATHLPVFLIYHVHLSLGGIADRVYWCVIGYTMLTPTFLQGGHTTKLSS